MGGTRFICYLILQTLALVSSLDSFQEQCQFHCPLQNRTEDIHLDVECGTNCKIEQCLRGCELWARALEASCQAVCNGTQDLLPPKELYCVLGCNDALNRYLQELKDEMGTPAAPALVADSLTPSSLRLEWEEPRVSNLTYLVQWRYESAATPDSAWQYCRNQSWTGHRSTVLVENLKPYTKYRFRVAVLLPAHLSEPIVSEASLVIGTLPGGPPSSPPSSVRAIPTDPTRVSVSWKPGPFANGPILSYVLSIDELPQGYKAHKDIPAAENKDFYMFQSLLPSRNYSVSVAMRNAIGLGPAARTTVITPPLSELKEAERTILVLAKEHIITSQTDLIYGTTNVETIMYETESEIRGIALHVHEELLFVSESSGHVIVTGMDPSNNKSKKVILSEGHEGINFFPFSLSIDWLNNLLYVLGEATDKGGGTRWQIARCGLDGSDLTVAVAGLLTKPLHIEVDPYNGYLFWVIQENSKKGGLYRLDLADISNGIKHEISPDLILSNPNLGAFAVDHSNFRILVPSHSQNTVLAVSLDGHEINDIRNNTRSPKFQKVMSLATANGLFYWSNGKSILAEEYHSGQNNYFHNELLQGPMYVRVNLPSSQPVPVPVNPPTGLQAVLGAGVARTSWTMPHLLGGQGKGAWQNWSYQLSLYDTGDNISQEIQDINTTSFVVHNLQPATIYILRAAAYTSAGVGPWSAPFRGKTLSGGGSKAIILWSGAEGLLMSDPTGDTVQTLIHSESLKDIHGEQHIIDITWYEEQLFLVTNRSSIYHYNLAEKKMSRIRDIDTVGSIAVDWIGKKLYWSNPKQQLITRANLNGTHQEPLPILTVAKELNVDALHGYIYWSTGHAVECAHLNGKQRKTYYPAELFSGKQVMGLTLDMTSKSIYWIIRNYEGSTLFRAELAQELKYGEEIMPVKMSILQYPDMRGSLSYFDDHLLWLRDDSHAVIGDLTGRNLAILSGMSLTGLHAVTVIDSSLHSMRGDILGKVNVIPEEVANKSLRVEGTYDAFNITWDPVQNVNYGKVFYELKIGHTDRKDIVVETTDSFWNYEDVEQMTPYTPLFVSVRAFTYWGGSSQVRVVLHSPPSTPSQPVNPRVFVSHYKIPTRSEDEIITTFRWDSPISPNGVIISYKLLCWLDGSDELLCQQILLSGTTLEYVTREVPPNSTAFFQVLACTEVGCGVPSKAVRVHTGEESPIPRLLLTSQGILFLVDIDKRENRTLSHTAGGQIIDVSYSVQENKVFWIDDNNQVMTLRLDTLQKNKVVNLNGTGLSIAVDWIGRFLYWSERGDQKGTSHIKSLDLSQAENGNLFISTILTRSAIIYSIKIDPINSVMYWVEQKENKFTTLMRSKMNGSFLQEFFGHNNKKQRRWGRSACNCPESPVVGTPLTIDRTPSGSVNVVWLDAGSNNIVSSDLSACVCQVTVDSEQIRDAGLPPTSITIDRQLIFWSNETEGLVYGLPKSLDRTYETHRAYIQMISAVNVRSIVAFESHLQPYPGLNCLVPEGLVSKPKMIEKSNESITLELPEPQTWADCSSVSLASLRYTVHYGIISSDGISPCAININNCSRKDTFKRILKLENLKPFSGYVFLITFSNYYSKLVKIVPQPSLPVVFKTAAGAPSPPQEVTAVVLSPNSIQVSWSPSKIMNSQTVLYEVFWRSDSLIDGVRHKGERIVSDSSNTTVRLDKLTPGQNYAVWVRAYSQSRDTYSESSSVNVWMHPEPENITLVQATAYSLNISWHNNLNISDLSHELQYSDATTEWQTVPLSSENMNQEVYFLENLTPKMMYTFRLKIVYFDEIDSYIWPHDTRFTFRTLGDKPTIPGVPVMQQLRDDVYQLTWEPSKDNGAPLELYWLEGKKIQEEVSREKRRANFTVAAHYHAPTIIPDEWTLYYNGTDNYWIITDLDINDKYRFRVRARNSYGWSDYSKESSFFDLSKASLLADKQEITLIILIPAAIVLIMFTFMCVFYRQKKEKKAMQINSTLPTATSRLGNTDVELATLRELPRRSNFIQNSNALYTGTDCLLNTDVSSLPHLSRDQITLTKFLGSGAFGEVFEGKARSLPSSDESEIRVAIKTLRKGATEQEKAEFLKEAQLMSNFKHPHILQLLGVCLDNDPNFIIMELMEGGDLLSYLRSSRPVMSTETTLTLLDLLSMSVDVARGCCYLEEMHFVHRDLACRNCLVSSSDPSSRLVKIGDFGLARDIYKNDYYRKEGEGLLPVRWMAPESLVDGVFTSQSDVWAFGVLVWEIMALGQQPYPARNNLEVLHYVRNGGRLGQPVNSTPEMYELMMKCWSFNPDERPTFRYCLDVLEVLKANSSNTPLHSAPANNSLVPRNERSDILGSVPKYLELIYEEGGSGYEIPRSLEPEHIQVQTEEDVSSLEKLLPIVKEHGVTYSNVTTSEPITPEVVSTA